MGYFCGVTMLVMQLSLFKMYLLFFLHATSMYYWDEETKAMKIYLKCDQINVFMCNYYIGFTKHIFS